MERNAYVCIWEAKAYLNAAHKFGPGFRLCAKHLTKGLQKIIFVHGLCHTGGGVEVRVKVRLLNLDNAGNLLNPLVVVAVKTIDHLLAKVLDRLKNG